MSDKFTKSMARNIFIGGSLFFFLLFVGLTFDTMGSLPKRDHRENITPQVANGKMLWEENNCIGCHTLLGEGAYFAPELGNVYTRFGQNKEVIKAFIASRPVEGIPGRRSMPQFNLDDQQLDDLAEFLKWTSEIDTNNWPPNVQG
ncbi:MAG: cytochrome c [Gammaproteobacteria bacterium]|nr:cytochrome c [Gammaproteobacteria bacterium]MCW8887829.1 cytochrome c [Gammaproteobacteria bacterium]MCW8982687.1 cytochrome c [Gammaproteobacteria bacterium]